MVWLVVALSTRIDIDAHWHALLYTVIGNGLPLLMQFFMWLTLVVFPMPNSGLAGTLFHLNPVTPLILTTRNLLTGFLPEFLSSFIWVNVGMLILIGPMWVVYRAAIPILIKRMSA